MKTKNITNKKLTSIKHIYKTKILAYKLSSYRY
jgi:hypothetical protein